MEYEDVHYAAEDLRMTDLLPDVELDHVEELAAARALRYLLK